VSLRIRKVKPEDSDPRPSNSKQGNEFVKGPTNDLPEQLDFQFAISYLKAPIPAEVPENQLSIEIKGKNDDSPGVGISIDEGRLSEAWYRTVDPEFNSRNPTHLDQLCQALERQRISLGWREIAHIFKDCE
jgi:hypothetical protein